MKAIRYSVLSLLMFLASCVSSSHDNTNDNNSKIASAYQCPMKCEGNITYEEPGACPVCHMDLELLNGKGHTHENH